jgi:hypothetical protein
MTIRDHFDQFISDGHDAGWIAATAEKQAKSGKFASFTRTHWLNLAAFARYMDANDDPMGDMMGRNA